MQNMLTDEAKEVFRDVPLSWIKPEDVGGMDKFVNQVADLIHGKKSGDYAGFYQGRFGFDARAVFNPDLDPNRLGEIARHEGLHAVDPMKGGIFGPTTQYPSLAALNPTNEFSYRNFKEDAGPALMQQARDRYYGTGNPDTKLPKGEYLTAFLDLYGDRPWEMPEHMKRYYTGFIKPEFLFGYTPDETLDQMRERKAREAQEEQGFGISLP
jgi:hypothetical protein